MRLGAGLAGPAGGVQGPADFLVAEADLAGGIGERAQVGARVSFGLLAGRAGRWEAADIQPAAG